MQKFYPPSLWILRTAISLAILAATIVGAQAQRFVKTFNTTADMLAVNPNDVHTNAFVSASGLLYTYNSASAAATNAEALKPNNFNGRWLQANGYKTTASAAADLSGKVDIANGTHNVISTGSTTARSTQLRFSNWKHVEDFGASTNLSTDSTAAFQLAYDSLKDIELGGVIYAPRRYKADFPIFTNDNITILGGGSMVDYDGVPGTSYIMPATPGRPHVRVGDGTRIVRGFSMQNLTLRSPDLLGNLGVWFDSAQSSHNYNVTIVGYKTNGWAYPTGDVNNPCSEIHFIGGMSHSSTQPGARGWVIQQRPNQIPSTTAIFFDNFDFQGPSGTNSLTLEVIGSEVNLANLWLDNNGYRGIWLTNVTGGVGPHVSMVNVKFDSHGAGPVAYIPSDANTSLPLYFDGFGSLASYVQSPDGTARSTSATHFLAENAELFYPQFIGAAYWSDGTKTNLDTRRNVSISGSNFQVNNTAGAVQLNASLGVAITASGGAVQVTPSAGNDLVVNAASVSIGNTRSYKFKDSGGTDINGMSMSVGNIIGFASSALGGGWLFSGTHADAYMQWVFDGATRLVVNKLGLRFDGLTASKLVLTDGSKYAVSSTLSEANILTESEAATAYQPLDPELTALSGQSGTGIYVVTGAGTGTTRTITGDAEAVVVNGNGVSGNPTLSIGAGIARDAEVAAAYPPATRTIATGAGLSGGGDLSANRTLLWEPNTYVANVVMWDGSQASRTWTFSLSGSSDPVWTIGDGSMDLTTGTLKQGGTAVVLTSRTISAGAGLSGGGDLSANRTLTWEPNTYVGNLVLWDASQSTRTITYNLSGGTDPVWTIGNNSVDLTTGVLKYGGATVSVVGHVHAGEDITSGTVDKDRIDSEMATDAEVAATYTPMTRTITAGSGLTGGGDLSANRTIAVDWTVATNTVTVACSDMTTALAAGANKAYWRAPFAMTVRKVKASVFTASSSGPVTVDIHDSGTTIMASTKITIDQSEKTSEDAVAPVLTDTSIAADAEITFDIDAAGTGAAGLLVQIYYTLQ